MTLFKYNALSLLILAVSFAIAGGIITVSAQETPSGLGGIVYPIAELGNCVDKESCRDYCDDATNIAACIDFAKARGLVSPDEAERGKKFADRLKTEGGPGGCTTPGACRAYCESVDNLSACVDFMKKHKLASEHTGEAEKLAAYKAAGGMTPGNCGSRSECQTYCGDFSNANECRAFIEGAKLSLAKGDVSSPAQWDKLVELAKAGRTPGKCTNAVSCNLYCSDLAHRTECIAFGREAGLIEESRAERLIQGGVTGPGGCDSAESCKAFCDDQGNRGACFTFAKEQGLISDERLKSSEETLVRFRQGLSSAPMEVAECLKATLGPEIILNIQAGKLTPGPDIAERVQVCFQKAGKKIDFTEEVRRASVDVVKCFREKTGESASAVRSASLSFTPETADALRVCAERERLEKVIEQPAQGTSNTRSTSTLTTPSPARQDNSGIRSLYVGAPQTVQACVRGQLPNFLELIASGQTVEGVREAFAKCFDAFDPTEPVVPTVRSVPTPGVPSGDTSSSTSLIPPPLPMPPLPNSDQTAPRLCGPGATVTTGCVSLPAPLPPCLQTATSTNSLSCFPPPPVIGTDAPPVNTTAPAVPPPSSTTPPLPLPPAIPLEL